MKNLILTLSILLCFLQVKSQDKRTDTVKLNSDQPMTAHGLKLMNFWVDHDEAVSITLLNLYLMVHSSHGGTGDKFQPKNGLTIIMTHDGKDTALNFDFHFPQNGTDDPSCDNWTPVQTLNKIVTIHREGRYTFYLNESDWYQASGHHDGPISIRAGSTMAVSR